MIFEPAVAQDDRIHQKRFFAPEQVQLSAKVPPAFIGKRTFPRDASMYAVGSKPQTPRELHEWSEAESRRRFVCPSTLEFTRPGKAWAPVGGKGGRAIPQPPPSPRAAGPSSSNATPDEKASSPRGGPPSDRIMSRPHRVELSPKLPLPKKDVDVKKLMERMEQNVKRRQARIDANLKKSVDQTSPKGAAKKTGNHDDGTESTRSRGTDAELSEFHRRLVEEPLQQRERILKSLQEKLTKPHSASPPRVLSPREQKSMSQRLYHEGIQHQKKTIQLAVKKYIDDVAPKFSSLTQQELKTSADRLYSGEH